MRQLFQGNFSQHPFLTQYPQIKAIMDGGRVQFSQPSEQSMYGKPGPQGLGNSQVIDHGIFPLGISGMKVQSMKTFETVVSFLFVKRIHTSL